MGAGLRPFARTRHAAAGGRACRGLGENRSGMPASVSCRRFCAAGVVIVPPRKAAMMQGNATMKNYLRLTLAAALLSSGIATAEAQNLPPYMAPIAGRTAAAPSDTAVKDMLALNAGMFELYDSAARVFQQNILSKHPLILGLFSGSGGRLILYRPGRPPLEAPQVPIVYQLLKSVGHSTMAL